MKIETGNAITYNEKLVDFLRFLFDLKKKKRTFSDAFYRDLS
jgi:hypothetical protein